MVLFSTRKGNLPNDMSSAINVPKDLKFAIYFNILGIIVLEEPTDYFDKRVGQVDAKAFGVENIVEFEEVPEAEEDVDDEPVESAGNVLDENVL